MNQTEKDILARIYRCVGRLGTVGPRNPADIAGLAKGDGIASKAAPQIATAISCLGYGDYADARDYLNDAECTLGMETAATDA